VAPVQRYILDNVAQLPAERMVLAPVTVLPVSMEAQQMGREDSHLCFLLTPALLRKEAASLAVCHAGLLDVQNQLRVAE